jgi:GNAT superfamily N-acetyltransferase
MHIRPSTARDADRLAPLLGQLGYPTAAATLAPRLERLLSHPEYAVWVAEGDGGSLHGLAVGHVAFSIEGDGPAAQLTALVVDRSAQRTGLGRRLVETFENWAGENAVVQVVVTSATHRAAAHAFYERLGYELTGRRFDKRLGDPQTRP